MSKKQGLFVLIMLIVTSLAGSAFAADSSDSQSWNISVGKETDSTSLDSMFPKVLFIHEGDKVTFTNGAKLTPHTVTFLAGQQPLNPNDPKSEAPTAASGVSYDGKTLLSSGILPPNLSYDITFTSSGVFNYYCVLHPMMTGTVVVLAKGLPIPSKTEQVAAARAQEQELLLQLDTMNHSNAPMYKTNANGTLTYQVDMGTAHGTMSHNRMIPELVVVSEGDSVAWTNLSPYEPHFVTFNKPKDMNFFTEQGGFNPAFLAPSGSGTFNGSGFTNSGILMSGQTYPLKFTKTGTYAYECYLHSGSKMTGTVVVVPKNAVKLIVNGKAIGDSAKAEWKNGTLFVSLDSFAKAVGGKVTKKSKAFAVNGKQLVTPGYTVKGIAFASAEEIVRVLGGSYSWNQATKTLTVTAGTAVSVHMNH
ncbi:plastocyanin/azurin family copper-binding protein [Cohnella pontilimi]|nr:plastocyanin/azurin family copper-binding protein [Cohnella pontilimi]